MDLNIILHIKPKRDLKYYLVATHLNYSILFTDFLECLVHIYEILIFKINPYHKGLYRVINIEELNDLVPIIDHDI